MNGNELSLTPPLIGRLWLLGSLFLVSLPHLLRFPPWLTLCCMAVFLWRALHELRGFDLPGKWIRLLLVTLGIGSVLLVYHTIVGRDPGVALLTVMMCLKLFEISRMRDALIALFIGYFMVISGFLFSQSIFMGAYLFLVVLALTAALAALNHPDGGRPDNRFYLGFSGKLLLQSLPLMVLMFLLFPRLSNPLWQMPTDPTQAKTGLSDSMKMGTITNLVESPEVAFRVDFNGPIPLASQLYWRGPVLWNTDGRSWQQHRQKPTQTLPTFEASGNPISYTVTLEPNNRHWLFAIDLPVQLPQLLKGRSYVTEDFQLLSKDPVENKLRYSVQSNTAYRISSLLPWMEKLATQLPDDRNPRTFSLAQQWRAQGLTPAAIVQEAMTFFREQPFYYTRQPPLLGDQPVDHFLFETRRGFCEHYAAAFVTLMRSAGIPARVVTGYQGGELNAVGNYLIVRQANAHAWAEVWLDGRGWQRFDPTTMVPPERVETAADSSRFQSTTPVSLSGDNTLMRNAFQQLRFSWDAVNHSWNQWVLGFDRNKQEELLRRLGLNDLSWQRLITVMIAMIAVVLGILGLGLLRRRPYQPDPVLRTYRQFCEKVNKMGISHRPSEGPSDFAQRIGRERPDLAALANSISELYIRLRYAPNADTDALVMLRKQVRAFPSR